MTKYNCSTVNTYDPSK